MQEDGIWLKKCPFFHLRSTEVQFDHFSCIARQISFVQPIEFVHNGLFIYLYIRINCEIVLQTEIRTPIS